MARHILGGVKAVKKIIRYIATAMIAVSVGVMLALLLPIYFVAGVEAMIIIFLACCYCFGKK